VSETADRAPQGTPVHVLIVDDHRTFAEALALAMESRGDMRCSGIAASVDEALRLLAEEPCDVVLMDVALHGPDGIEGTRRIRRAYPETRVLVMTGHLDASVLARAVEAGAAGFLPKDGPFADLVDAVVDPPISGLAIGTGTPMAVVAEAMRLREQAPAAPHTGADSLTRREVEVLGLLAEGLPPTAVARRLGITLHTCRGHIKSVLAKLEVHSQLEAVVVGWHRGLIRRPGEP